MAGRKTVILIGMPGCGKSVLGMGMARQLCRRMVDLDTEIEARAGKTIPEIFRQGGEAAFRKEETAAFAALADCGGILATGGGIVTVEQNREIARRGLVVFIDRPLDSILGDINTQTRPLLAQGKERLYRLYEERYPRYCDWADIRIVNDGSPEEAVKKMCKEVENYEIHGD